MDTSAECAKKLKMIGWSQEDIAGLLGVTRPTIRRLLDGEEVYLSVISQKLLELVASSSMPINEMKARALKEYVERHYLKEAYLHLASEIDS